MENMDEAMFNEIAGGADYPFDMYVRVIGERNGTDYGLLRVSSKWHAMALKYKIGEKIGEHVNRFDISLNNETPISFSTTVEGNGIHDFQPIYVCPVY